MKNPLAILFVIVVALSNAAYVEAAISFASRVRYSVTTASDGVKLADFDGDGDNDIAATGGNNVAILLNNGSGAFADAVYYAVGDTPKKLAVGNFDGANGIDIATVNNGGDNVSVLLNNGNGTFAAAVNYVAATGSRGIASADLDGDSDVDLAVANESGGNVSVFLNNGSGVFAAAVNYAAGSETRAIFLADVDGDSDTDIATADGLDGTISVLKNNGDGTFAAAIAYDNESNDATGYGMFGADVDGDGDIDLVVSNEDLSRADLMSNNGSGVFSFTAGYDPSADLKGVFLADLDNDGDNDLATANGTTQSATTFANNGSGVFSSASSFDMDNSPADITGADLDDDGDIDLVSVNESASVSVALNALLSPSTGGNPFAPFSFAEQRRRLALRLAPNTPTDVKAVSYPCRNGNCPADIIFAYAPNDFHRGYSTSFVLQDDTGRTVEQVSAVPQNGKEYRMTLRGLKSNQAFSGKLCVAVEAQQSCRPISVVANIALDPESISVRATLADAGKKIHHVSFLINPLPVNYAVGATGMRMAIDKKVNGAEKRIAERAYKFTPFEAVLHEALPAGRYEITFIPQNAEGEDGGAVMKELALNGDVSKTRDLGGARAIPGKLDVAGEVERIVERFADILNQLKALLRTQLIRG